MNQTKFANELNISQQYVSKIINGHRRPCWEKAKIIAMLTGTNPELWLEGVSQRGFSTMDNVTKEAESCKINLRQPNWQNFSIKV